MERNKGRTMKRQNLKTSTGHKEIVLLFELTILLIGQAFNSMVYQNSFTYYQHLLIAVQELKKSSYKKLWKWMALIICTCFKINLKKKMLEEVTAK